MTLTLPRELRIAHQALVPDGDVFMLTWFESRDCGPWRRCSAQVTRQEGLKLMVADAMEQPGALIEAVVLASARNPE